MRQSKTGKLYLSFPGIVATFVLFSLIMVSCKDSSTSSFDDNDEMDLGSVKSEVQTQSQSQIQSSGVIVIDDFDSGAGTFSGSGHNSKFEYHESTTILGGAREIYLRDAASGTLGGATYATVDTDMGTLALYITGRAAPENAVMYGTAIGTTYRSWAPSPNIGSGSEMNLELTLDDTILIDVAGSGSNSGVTIVLRSGNGAVNSAGFTLDVGSNLIPLSDFSNLTESAASDIDGIAISGLNTFETFAIKNSEPVITNNVYVSDSSVQTWDPIYPPSADPNWTSTVCYQGNDFGTNANWVNPHNAFEVTNNGQPHPWDNSTFDAKWINSYNSMTSQGPGGHNWSRYETQVSGDGDFVIQLLADNCSWVYLADENGANQQLIGYQSVGSTPGEYGVSLSGDHTLTFIIFDGGGLAGGKFRLETTESFGGTPPPPIETNNAPVADAGADQTVTATGQTTPVTLDGSGSSDADEDALTYSWILDGSEISASASFSTNLPDGVHTLTLTVSDGQASDSDDVVITVENTVPEADAGPDRTIEATGPTTPVTINGSGTDADGDSPLIFTWAGGSTGETLAVNLAVGTHTFTLTVTDPQGASDTDDVTITIVDTTPPELSFTVENTELWPPNHKMRKVISAVDIADIADPNAVVDITVTSNEAINGRGDGNTDSDWEVRGDDVYVRAERSGKGSGRIYTITITGTDVSGNETVESVEVTVPHNQGKGKGKKK